MAVGGVEGELVSGGGSLLSRENTGNLAEFGLRTDRLGGKFSVNPGSWKRTPYGLEQGVSASEQAIRGADQGIKDPCSGSD
jgi:hypothetical protein